ncbi:cyclophilin-like fold protein [Bradyrhizobium diazoefficiens]|uniref:cyclophilin-like fold protein n=1 Tax=Bradyrhizobium diazoefficiens TaxID=1355477 RepID=UPI00272A6DDD|nr:cyclophilin-like fold protein [Bradyrhizobium diazoefficiens]WLA67520.1 cyclophilin-like fold protein [Bradyrhizobium diazoefficiens]
MPRHRPVRRSVLGGLLAIAAVSRPVAGLTATNASWHTGAATMRIRCAFDRHSFTVVLFDGPSARELVSRLPLDLAIEDYSTNEKIAYLPRKLTEDGGSPFADEAPGDLCYYAPWGNLVFFHDSYRYSKGLIRLGRLEDGIRPLLARGKYPLRIELLT